MEYEMNDARLTVKLKPGTVKTVLGPVEYVEFGDGPAVVAIHGAMGGWDQSLILAQTIGDVGYRYIAMSRPGYLGTPISSGKSPERQGDLVSALLDTLGIAKAGVMAVSGGGLRRCSLHSGIPTDAPGSCWCRPVPTGSTAISRSPSRS